jgi:hypothetical protein
MDQWYANGRVTNHLTYRNEWINTLEEVLVGKWPIKVANNQKLRVCGVGIIKVRFVINGKWEKKNEFVMNLVHVRIEEDFFFCWPSYQSWFCDHIYVKRVPSYN